MLIKDVLIEYNDLVPFPWTPRKIKKAGLSPMLLTSEICQKLNQCEDIDTGQGKAVLETMRELGLIP